MYTFLPEEPEKKKVNTYSVGEKVYALNFHGGQKWYEARISEVVARNVYMVHVTSLGLTWKRHHDQLLPCNISDSVELPLVIPSNGKESEINAETVEPEESSSGDVEVGQSVGTDESAPAPSQSAIDQPSFSHQLEMM